MGAFVTALPVRCRAGVELLRDLVLDSEHRNRLRSCLLYTSDAADERSSVDLGGRRIIKKTKKMQLIVRSRTA